MQVLLLDFLQNKAWTVDRIIKFGGQANPICQLCRTHQESAIHLLAQRPFSQSIWRSLHNWIGVDLQPLPQYSYRTIKTWWSSMLYNGRPQQGDAKLRLQKMIYAVWNIWKERCRRVYDNKVLSASQLQEPIRRDARRWLVAWSATDGREP
jgi:hypothetical protein